MQRLQHQAPLVTHIVAGLAQAHGGPSYSVPALSAALTELGVNSRVRFVADAHGERPIGDVRSVAVELPASPGPICALRASRALRSALNQDAREGALLHAHGLWLMPNLYPAWTKMRLPATLLVHSPRGMLAPAALEISRWKKRPFWHHWQKSALQSADCIHATAVSEYEEIRALGLLNPVAVIPNGIDVPAVPERRSSPHCGTSRRTILSLGRIHPKKALDVLVRAWATLEPHYPNWRVRIIGPAEGGYDEELRQLAKSLDLDRLSIEGPIYGADKLVAYCTADLFVLATRNENFGIAVAEALAARVPVISTKGAPWSGLELEGCGWWIEHGADPLVRALRVAMDTDPRVLVEMGQRGRAWMVRDFGWPRVANEMRSVYDWLRNKSPMPPTVRMN